MHNPYAPPEANVSDIAESPDSDATSINLNGIFSSGQIFLASFIGSPIAAAWFAASNFRILNQPAKARSVIIWGIVATVVVMAIAFVLPDKIPHSAFPLIYSIGIRAAAAAIFDPVVNRHKAAGGGIGSWWRVAGISFLWMLLVLASLFGVIFVFELFGVSIL